MGKMEVTLKNSSDPQLANRSAISVTYLEIEKEMLLMGNISMDADGRPNVVLVVQNRDGKIRFNATYIAKWPQ